MHVDSHNKPYFICIPFNRLSSELGGHGTTDVHHSDFKTVDEERQWIYKNIVKSENKTMIEDEEVMQYNVVSAPILTSTPSR